MSDTNKLSLTEHIKWFIEDHRMLFFAFMSLFVSGWLTLLSYFIFNRMIFYSMICLTCVLYNVPFYFYSQDQYFDASFRRNKIKEKIWTLLMAVSMTSVFFGILIFICCFSLGIIG